MDKVFIRDLRVRGIIGIHPRERRAPQEIVINVTLFTDSRRAAQSDDSADCVDYSVIAAKVRAHVETAARLTVEALANDLVNLCLQEKGVTKVIVRVEKPGAVPGAASAGIEIERRKPAGAWSEASAGSR